MYKVGCWCLRLSYVFGVVLFSVMVGMFQYCCFGDVIGIRMIMMYKLTVFKQLIVLCIKNVVVDRSYVEYYQFPDRIHILWCSRLSHILLWMRVAQNISEWKVVAQQWA